VEVSRKTLTIITENTEGPLVIQFQDKQNLLDLLNANKIGISQSCGGSGTCTTCRIFIQKNLASFEKRTELETERAIERNPSDDERLSCQCEILDSAEIKIICVDPS
jgi:ferredoxin, 2Fe-2S